MTDTPLSDDVLLPCPFCGAELLKEVTEIGRYWIHPPNSRSLGFDCILVDVSVGDFNDDRIAWNTRATLEAARYGEMLDLLSDLASAAWPFVEEWADIPEVTPCSSTGKLLASIGKARALLSSIGASQP